MSWEVEYTDQFGDWWKTLNDKERDRIAMLVKLLEARGPNLGFPYSSSIKSSRHGNMRELRTKHKGDPIRIIYAFDPHRVALLLIGGNKRGDDRWYKQTIPIADDLYDEHLEEITKEELDNG